MRYLDPAAPSSRNRYGVGINDAFVTDVVFGEVAVIPEWTQPSLSADTIRANGGAAPPPEPILPTQFTIQLYNPDQQIVVRHTTKSWNRQERWEFEMPQQTFRVPSSSTLDRTQSDPAAADITPKLQFSWRKDGKLSKDLSCSLHGKSSTVPDTRTKAREPDITVAFFQNLRELTLYEPNLYRVEMEDFKGLEVVLLLAAVAIRDLYFGPAKEAFHIAGGSGQAVTGPAASSATKPGRHSPHAQGAAAHSGKPTPPQLSIPQTTSPSPQQRRRQEELARAEERRTRELLAAEEKARRRREAEIEQETKRLQMLYGKEEQQARAQQQNRPPSPRPYLPPRHSGPSRPYGHQYTQSTLNLPSQTPQRHSHPQQPNQYLGVTDPRAQSTAQLVQPRPQSAVGFYPQVPGSAALPPVTRPNAEVQPKKSSFFGLKRSGEEQRRKTLEKKRSSVF